MELIYHLPEQKPKEKSPFKTKIKEFINEESIYIACPYINIDELTELLNSRISFKILTDVEEWLKSTSSSKKRESILKFINDHHKKIHHQRGLHSKVILNDCRALVGSANLTISGMYSNNEFSIFLNSEHHNEINEIKNWFDLWWQKTDIPDLDEVVEFMRFCNKLEQVNSKEKTEAIVRMPKINDKNSLIEHSAAIEVEGIFRSRGTGPDSKYKDGKEKYEITIHLKYANVFPISDGERVPIKLAIADQLYDVGLRYTTKNDVIWISPNAFYNNQKIRLADIVERHKIQRNKEVKMIYFERERKLVVTKLD